MSIEVIIYFTVLGSVLTRLFTTPRYDVRACWLSTAAIAAALSVVDVVVWRTLGLETFVALYSPLNHLPVLAVTALTCRERGWRLVFELLTAVLFCMALLHLTGLLYLLFEGSLVVAYSILLLATAALLVLLLRWLIPFWRTSVQSLERGWWLPCVLIGLYFVTAGYLVPGFAGDDLPTTTLKLAITLIMIGFYVTLVYLLGVLRAESQARHDAEMLGISLSALRSRLEAQREAEERMRLERHDLRHRLRMVAELVRGGERRRAEELLARAEDALDEATPRRWCLPQLLNAVLDWYLGRAEAEGVRVDATLDLPVELPVDETELALSNALENALAATHDAPEGARVIRVRAIAEPTLMVEVANTCSPDVALSADGLPRAGEPEHGLGTRSMVSFAERSGGSCEFAVEDGWFRVRLVL